MGWLQSWLDARRPCGHRSVGGVHCNTICSWSAATQLLPLARLCCSRDRPTDYLMSQPLVVVNWRLVKLLPFITSLSLTTSFKLVSSLPIMSTPTFQVNDIHT